MKTKRRLALAKALKEEEKNLDMAVGIYRHEPKLAGAFHLIGRYYGIWSDAYKNAEIASLFGTTTRDSIKIRGAGVRIIQRLRKTPKPRSDL